MGNLYGRIKIELMSDLCAGSGYSYAGVIDADVAYDEYGIPFIPARRLKGCMREAAGLVCPDAVETIFGKTGDDGTKGIILWNAYIEEYALITEELERLAGTEHKEASWLSPQNILRMYTAVRAQTKLSRDTGVAERNSLRYTRVVGQYDPLKEKTPLCFYAKILFADTDREQLEQVVKATRNIGMNRNRGLGSVRCSLTDVHEIPVPAGASAEEADEGNICLTYVLRNQEPLLMSSDNAEISDSYISGKSILGNLAGAYLAGEGRSAEDENFRELFLNGSTVFTNAYLTVPPETDRGSASQWPDYSPAPFYMNRLKKTKALVNLLGDDGAVLPEEEKKYNTENGNLPKKLKSHYIHETAPNVFHIVEPRKEILYHNSRRELLYSLEAMKEGQYFKGRIYVKRKYAALLKELLEKERLSFGKSRTAQYGNCVLAADTTIEDIGNAVVSARSGERVAVVIESDAIFLNGSGGYTVRFEEVKTLVGEQLGIPYDREQDWEIMRKCDCFAGGNTDGNRKQEQGSILQTREITGYNTKWNLRRPGVPAVKAGSVLVYTIKDGESWQFRPDLGQVFVGERNLEGYGQVRIRNCRDMRYAAKTPERQDSREEPLSLEKCRPFLLRILTGQLLERLIYLYTLDARSNKSRLDLTASTVGRLSLMLRESRNAYQEDPEKAFRDFCARVNSIKRTKEKEEAFSLLSATILKEEKKEKTKEYKLELRKISAGQDDPLLNELLVLLKRYASDSEYQTRIAAIWGIYMENILVYHKYQKKQEGGKEKDVQQ